MEDFYMQPMITFLKDFDELSGFSGVPDHYYRSLILGGVDYSLTENEIKNLKDAQEYFRKRGVDCE